MGHREEEMWWGLSHIQSVHHKIRGFLAKRYGHNMAKQAYIVYGGGITMERSLDIAALPDVNGLFTTGCGIYAEFVQRTGSYNSEDVKTR